jgi:hypothetical protein
MPSMVPHAPASPNTPDVRVVARNKRPHGCLCLPSWYRPQSPLAPLPAFEQVEASARRTHGEPSRARLQQLQNRVTKPKLVRRKLTTFRGPRKKVSGTIFYGRPHGSEIVPVTFSRIRTVTRPSVLVGLRDHPGANRIEFDVTTTGQRVAPRIHQARLEATFPQRSRTPVPTIERAYVIARESMHQPRHATRFVGRHKQMHVVTHQHIGMQLAAAGATKPAADTAGSAGDPRRPENSEDDYCPAAQRAAEHQRDRSVEVGPYPTGLARALQRRSARTHPYRHLQSHSAVRNCP